MKRVDLLPKGPFFKANLHSHSTLSDGELSPERLREAYQNKGYQVLAITDHNHLESHEALSNENFLLLTAYEVDFNEREGDNWVRGKCCHLNLYSPTPCPPGQPDEGLSRAYTPESINAIIQKARALGYLVSYNHPQWSMETGDNYNRYEGCFAMEVRNYGCTADGRQDSDNILVYEEMLRHGKRLGVLATDDNHNRYPFDHPNCDSFGGFTMIAAPELTYEAVFRALQKGDYYASGGPEIRGVWIEDGFIHIECAPCEEIILACGSRRAERVARGNGPAVTGAKFKLQKSDGYVRLEISDEKGNRAYTRAYFPGDDFDESVYEGSRDL